MRDLAAAAGLNVASLYHYFPSKQDLLQVGPGGAGLPPRPGPPARAQRRGTRQRPASRQLLADILVSMFEVEDFVRLMVGEAIRGESTALAVGRDLFTSFQGQIEQWVAEHRPDLVERAGAGEVSRLLSAMVVGMFVQHAAGVLGEEEGDLTALSLQRALETARILGPPA